MKESLQALFSCLETNEISVRVFKNVEKHKESLCHIFAYLKMQADNEKRKFKTEKKICKEWIEKKSELVGEYDVQYETVETVVNICCIVSREVNIEIKDFQQIEKDLKKCKRDEHLVGNLQSDDFWGSLTDAFKPAEVLKNLTKSISFRRVAIRYLKSEHDGSNEISLSDLLTILAGTCIERFHSEWRVFLTKPDDDDQTVQKLEDLVGCEVSGEDLVMEIAILVKNLDKKIKIPDRLKNDYVKAYAKREKILKDVEIAVSVLQMLGFASKPAFQSVMDELQSFALQIENKVKVSIKTNHACVQKVQKYLTWNPDTKSVLQQLHRSPEVVTFVQKTVNEDLHFMVEEVEEHAEQLKVTELLVTELIDVHQFWGKIIQLAQSSTSVKEFFLSLEKLLKMEISMGADLQRIGEFIEDCDANISSLDGLYKSVANQVDISKGIIANCLKTGKYSVHVNRDGECVAKINYDDINGEHFLPDLQNLRSRAYLISNATQYKRSSKHYATFSPKINYYAFVTQVDLLTEICGLLTQIRPLEFLKYDVVEWMDLQSTSSLRDKRDELLNDLEEWGSALSAGRSKYFFLNFYRSHQLRILYQFFSDPSKGEHHNAALCLFKVIDPEIELNKVQEKLDSLANNGNAFGDSPEALVDGTGDALQSLFKDTVASIRPLTVPSSASSSVENMVKDGEIFIVKLDEESPQTANVMLALYANTCKSMPLSHEVLFCSTSTEWEEVDLLLNRCTFLSKQKLDGRKSLYCLANVDLLKPEIKSQLEKRLKVQNSQYRLMLICRGKNCDHIFEEFNQYTHQICGMTDTALSNCLEKQFPDVVVYTSVLPGLGKSEKIKAEACEKGKNVITFAIYDLVDWNQLVARLKSLSIKSYHCLHFDIGNVDNPSLLDNFLFQLIVIGMVSSSTELFHLPTSHVYIEIANTLQESLRDSLQICKYFKSVRLNSFSYDDLVVSSDVNSNVQLVCQYLHAYQSGSLEDNDISIRVEDGPKPLPRQECRQLLSVYFPSNQNMSFTILKIFLTFQADQLRKFSESAYFKTVNVQNIRGIRGRGIRTNLFEILMDVSKQFSTRSIKTNFSQQNEAFLSSNTTIFEAMIKRVEKMARWEDSNKLILVFHGRDSQSLTPFYRNKDDVPEKVRDFLKSQATGFDRRNQDIADYSSMSTNELRAKLQLLASSETTTMNHNDNLDPYYAITPDNIHKMILIILRVRGRIPVILMGETGCGKTSLVRYLATICKIPFSVFSLHAGIQKKQILEYIERKEIDAKSETWIFLDEINTTDHMGLINEIMCHHTMLGRPLSKKLVFLAACNPYKFRSEKQIKTAGLEHKIDRPDEYSHLVYRVHPLPEAMLDYVWDFGFLKEKDEMSYIQRMVSPNNQFNANKLLAKLLAVSQMFVRKVEANFSVSLRDVSRCIALINWFAEALKSIREYPISAKTKLSTYSVKDVEKCDPIIKSYILGLAHCYLYRLSTTELRNKYCTEMAKHLGSYEVTSDTFKGVVRMMEENLLNRMKLPPGTCKNNSLRENVFVILVCILNRIPVFVVGKPGCSKSLSMRIIKSNLRGRDSTDAFFKTLPHIYVVSYQSSESSSSEGIERVFEKARKYARCNKGILPVVLLDEVGLAGCSKHNPLKVLHSLLEPESSTETTSGHKNPEIAVVGISNWALDAAKMNRAIHLSKPDPDVDDLHNTAISIMCEIRESGFDKHSQIQIRKLAESYHNYQRNQTYPNFHGLRDYYSLIKNLTNKSPTRRLEGVNLALQRNFGGLPTPETVEIQLRFLDNQIDRIYPVTHLIKENLVDPLARHLMLFTKGDSVIDILRDTLSSVDKEVETIYGSHFDEDQSETYNYRILSLILYYMEQSCILILRDLEPIYGALYDMLNQSYTMVDEKRMCRVAIGANSNPTCLIHDEFRCIVLKDDKTIDFTDPPFLNRFEKQLLRYSHALSKDEIKNVTVLSAWVDEISRIEGLHDAFGPSDMFIGFHEDTLPSLLFSHAKSSSSEDLLELCKVDLMWIASPEAVVRAKKSDLFKESETEVRRFTEEYFKKPLHHGLAHLITVIKQGNSSYLAGDEIGSRCLVMTYSGTRINDISRCQVEVLSLFNSEKQLTKAIASFWNSEVDVLILQCVETDAPNLLLARTVVENERKAYERLNQGNVNGPKKHVIILIHVERQHSNSLKSTWQFSFSGGWKQVFVDVLEDQRVSLQQIHSASMQEMLHKTIWPVTEIAKNVLLWCFSCIEYVQNQRDLDSTYYIISNLLQSEKVTCAVEKLVNTWLSSNTTSMSDGYLQAEIACNKEQLVNSTSFFSALKNHVFDLVRVPLAKFIFFLENNNAWPPHLTWISKGSHDVPLKSDLESFWCELILNTEIFNMASILDTPKYGVYGVTNVLCDLHFPFSYSVIAKIEYEIKQLFLSQLEINDDEKFETAIQFFETTVSTLIPEPVSTKLADRVNQSVFQDDVLDVFSAPFKESLTREQRVSFLTAALALHIDLNQDQLPSASSFCFQLLAKLWTNEQRLLDQLQMISTCLQFVDENTLSSTFSDANNLTSNNENSENSEEQEDKFQNALFTYWSEALLPSPNSVETRNKGLESWVSNAKIFLLFTRRMQSSVNSVHFLRFCVDFATTILLPSKIPNKVDYLYQLGDIGRRYSDANAPTYLDSKDAFREIQNLILDIKRNQTIALKVLEAFNSQFFGRCIETNIDIRWIEVIIKRVLHVLVQDDKKTAAVMIPVIWRVLDCEIDEIYEVLEGCFTWENKAHNLSCIDNTLKELHPPNKCNQSYACTVICDIIERLLHPDFYKIDLKSEESDIASVKIARKAVEILSRKNKGIDLTFLIAVAYLRRFLATISDEIYESPALLVKQISIESPLAEINSIFKIKIIDEQEQSPLLIFCMKQLLSKMNVFDLRKICQSSTAIDSLASCFPNKASEYSKAKFEFYDDFEEYKEAKNVYYELRQSSLNVVEKLSAFLHKCKQSKKHLLALMVLFIDKFVLKRANKKLNDSEARMAVFFSEKIMNLPESEARFLLHALINEKFNDEFLQLSPEFNVSNVQQALLILHIACVTSIRNENFQPSLLFNCLKYQPGKNDNTLITKIQDKSFFKPVFAIDKKKIFSCTCGLRICRPTTQPCDLCPSCNIKLNLQEEEFAKESEQELHEVQNKEVAVTDFFSSILNIFAYSNFYAGMALGFTIEQEIEKLLQIKKGQGITHCLTQVRKELECIASFVGLTEAQAVCLVHLVVKRYQQFMFNMVEENSESWFAGFAKHAAEVLEEIWKQPKKLKEFMLIQSNQNVSYETLEHKILELDDHVQQSSVEGDQRLKFLLRMKKTPTFEGFHCYFEILTKECRAKYSFLSLFFNKHDVLKKIGQLHHLLEWTRYVYSQLNHRISREDAKVETIDSFNQKCMKRSEEEKNRCSRLFRNFKKAWQDIRKDIEEMPNLNEIKLCLAYCIINENDENGKYLYMAIKYLSSAQNEILDQLLWISASQDDQALSFLHRNSTYTAIQQVSLQVAKEKDIISYEWKEEWLLAYAHNDLDYGLGEIVCYDVERISARLAESIAFGKSYLHFKLDRFIFSNEFFDSCAELLTEIQKLIPQERQLLDDMEKNLLENRKTRNYKELLAHLQMLMFLIKRIKSVENDMPLTLFIQKWKKMLPSPFPESSLPEPKESIKLHHIVALCEELECTLADGAIEGLNDNFRNKPLTKDMENELQIFCDSFKVQGISLIIFSKILRRFVFRYCSSANFKPENTISACLANNSLWTTVDVIPSADVFPKEITLGYLYETIAFIDRNIKVRPTILRNILVRGVSYVISFLRRLSIFGTNFQIL